MLSTVQVLAVDGRHWKSLLNKSVALIGLGRLAEAQGTLQKAFKLSGGLTASQAFVCCSGMLQWRSIASSLPVLCADCNRFLYPHHTRWWKWWCRARQRAAG